MTQHDEWKIRIEEYKKSGLSLVAFSKQYGLKYYMLKYWFYRFRDLEQQKKIEVLSFKELPRSTSGLKIKWQNITLEIESGFDPSTLRQFLTALN